MPKTTKTETILFSIFSFLLAVFLTLSFFYVFSLPRIKKEIRKEAFLEAKRNDFELLVKKANFPKEPESVVEVQGIIEKRDEKERTLFVKILEPFDPLNYLFLDSDNFKVLVLNDTEIFLVQPEDSEKLSRALFEYNKAVKEGKTPPPFPEPYLKTKIDFSQIKEKQKIKVVFKDNIKFKGEGKAKLIEAREF
jgi:hypothetical protein